MKLSVISFTQNGLRLSEQLAERWEGGGNDSMPWESPVIYTKCSAVLEKRTEASVRYVKESLGEWAGVQMKEGNLLLFIGACGIAVRAIAPHLTDKLHDSPVLVMDEKGAYVIPILSGHFGGANEFAMRLAGAIGATAVITTATDLNRKFAVDLFAKKNDLNVVNKDGIVKVSSKVLAGKEITISIENGHLCQSDKVPAGVRTVPYPPQVPVDIVVTSEEKDFNGSVLLRPREYVIGMGCRRGKEEEKIEAFMERSLREAGVSAMQVFALASIEQKKEEQGFVLWSRKNRVPFLTFTAEELKEVAGVFHTSEFVKEKVGVDNVCERAALRACGADGRLIYEKHAEDGMTIAIAKREWSVRFDEK